MVEGVRIQDVSGATMGQSDPHEGRWTMGLYQTMRIVSIPHHSTFLVRGSINWQQLV